MRQNSLKLLFAAAFVVGMAAFAGAQRPEDRVIPVEKGEAAKFAESIRPYTEQAKRTYPAAKARYLKGLPQGQSFFITAILRDSDGRFEQVFILVTSIANGTVTGKIANDIEHVKGFAHGDVYRFPESEMVDWTITSPDGSEEGNFVGKFLDSQASVRPDGEIAPQWNDDSVTRAELVKTIEETVAKVPPGTDLPAMALYNVAYPTTQAEIKALDSNAVAMATVMSHSGSYLPVKSVVAVNGDTRTELRILKRDSSALPVSEKAVSTFGKFRESVLFLFPVSLRREPGFLVVIMADGKEMKIARTGTPLSAGIEALNIGKGTGKGPDPAFLERFSLREFPIFAGK